MKETEEGNTSKSKDAVTIILNRHERRKHAALERKRAKDELRDKKKKNKSNPIHGS